MLTLGFSVREVRLAGGAIVKGFFLKITFMLGATCLTFSHIALLRSARPSKVAELETCCSSGAKQVRQTS
jgi:hypothetical protein